MRTLLTFLFAFTSLGSFGQISSPKPDEQLPAFIFVSARMDTSGLTYIRTLQGSTKKGEEISDVYLILRQAALKLGANCFRLRGFDRNATNKTITLTLAVYKAEDLYLKLIRNQQDFNAIYIFTDDKFSNQEFNVKLNEEKVSIPSSSFFRYVIEPNKEVRINKGGFSGSTVWVKWEERNPARYYSLQGFALANHTAPMPSGGVGIGFNTGRIINMDPEFGSLLSEIFKHAGGLKN